MNIAIIGAGNVGKGLAQVFSQTRHNVILGTRTTTQGKSAAKEFNADTGKQVIGTDISEAVTQADVVIMAVPYGAIENVLVAAGDLSGKIIVDATNPVNDDYTGLVVGFDTSAAEQIQGLAGNVPVVKAFNTVFAQIYALGPRFDETQVQVFLASDNEQAKQAVTQLVHDAGFDPVDAGPLKNARFLEPLAGLNIQLGYALGRGTQIAPIWIEREAA